ncbi:hypothetical protein [Profundibacterium mesophilum]|uniref:Prokaryotic membrane lipoprotein lipid attachment site domain containing protein n=1 Tax=Profundibacterium mesophilum KAUST100406-0324 TaxID=1037889 RepID=A0A921NRP8_9RHOB|nr:hypothetical protein [Profundibacterium mesophilum]KAF0676427.1 Prokaryotic membrane lipoprotein lipid attachment site domain containing protein [Profundibacterium mesophilum KAUST100406-0324]
MRNLMAALAAAALLGGCAATSGGPPERTAPVQRAAYAQSGPSSLTLYTVINNRSGAGAHTGLLINASQRVLWDPAGSFYHPDAPERGDVLYGFTPQIELVYEDYHARETFRIVEQTVEVAPEIAEQALRLAMGKGAASRSTCSLSTTSILRQLPGFEAIGSSWFPKVTMARFGALDGVTQKVITDDDADANHGVLIRAERRNVPKVPPPQLQDSR